jgi:hypothetical protein
LKLAEKTAYWLAAEGKLPGFKVGGGLRFKESNIEHNFAKPILPSEKWLAGMKWSAG